MKQLYRNRCNCYVVGLLQKWLHGISIEPVVLPVQIPTKRQICAANALEHKLAIAETQEGTKRTRQPLKRYQLIEF